MNASSAHRRCMTDSLIDEAVTCCRDVMEELDDGPLRRSMKLRLGLLEGAAWSIALEPAAREEVVLLVRLLLELRDAAVRARSAQAAQARRLTTW
jgi:hypothetical protein